jgi:hypothetical protein
MALFHHRLKKKDEVIKFTLRRIRLDRGGYDNGCYWGIGAPLYFAQSNGEFETWSGNKEIEFYLRADDRADAKAQIVEEFPGAKFYN